jgi:uncharacterized protein (TIGR02453 family)
VLDLPRVEKKYSGPGYYVRITFDGSGLAAGTYRPDKDKLEGIRKRISAWPKQFEAIVEEASFKKHYGGLTGEKLKRPPAGFKKDDPAIEWIKGKSFLGWHEVPRRIVTSRKIVDHAMEVYRSAGPLIEFFRKGMGL